MADYIPKFPQEWHAYSAQKRLTVDDFYVRQGHDQIGDLAPLWGTPFHDITTERAWGEEGDLKITRLDQFARNPRVAKLYLATFHLVSVEEVPLQNGN
jgi:hypothetical protein